MKAIRNHRTLQCAQQSHFQFLKKLLLLWKEREPPVHEMGINARRLGGAVNDFVVCDDSLSFCLDFLCDRCQRGAISGHGTGICGSHPERYSSAGSRGGPVLRRQQFGRVPGNLIYF
jgi:hypothetical protein